MSSIRSIVGKDNATQEASKPRSFDDNEIRALVECAAGGDIEAFGELYSFYLDRIYRYVKYQVRNKEAAEDLTEEIFIKAWRGLGKYRWDGYPFSAWLYRIARNHVVDYFRTNRQYQNVEMELLAGDSDPEREVESKQMEQLLANAITYLPEQQRQVIVLKFIEGMDNREIEQIMGMRQGAIRVMQMRALAALRHKLSGKG
jgi:RNA polymerase sigma-70 factor (ECF subfamily)